MKKLTKHKEVVLFAASIQWHATIIMRNHWITCIQYKTRNL